ncbi:P2X purinoceptor 7-like isoform X2 [Ixodes scapularis]
MVGEKRFGLAPCIVVRNRRGVVRLSGNARLARQPTSASSPALRHGKLHPLFELYCLNTDILDLEYLKLRYFCPLDAGDRGPQERHRYTAYRQFTWCVHHKLGRGNRVPLPSCAVQRIRREFPSTDGSYVGFKK